MPVPIINTPLSFGSLSPLSKNNVEYLVVHTQGAPGNEDGSAAGIHAYHKKPKAQGGRGWAGIGYHFVVRKNGQVERGRPLDRQGAHVQGYNRASVGICCSGNGDLADLTAQQKGSLRDLVRDLRSEFVASTVQGHRPLVDHLIGTGLLGKGLATTKTCPGVRVNLNELQQLIGLDLPAPIRGDRRWSKHLNSWIVLRRYVSDSEWYFVRASRPNDPEIRAHARWSEMPLAPT